MTPRKRPKTLALSRRSAEQDANDPGALSRKRQRQRKRASRRLGRCAYGLYSNAPTSYGPTLRGSLSKSVVRPRLDTSVPASTALDVARR